LDKNQKPQHDRRSLLMSNEIIREIIEKADLLSTEEQLSLITELAQKARVSAAARPGSRRKWSDLIGMLSYPACEEDAQTYISRSRREADDKRLADANRRSGMSDVLTGLRRIFLDSAPIIPIAKINVRKRDSDKKSGNCYNTSSPFS